MLTEEAKKELTQQQYRVVGSHSAVKVCGWAKKHIRGEGQCYKHTFYGINSHQCLQLTTALSCANRCVFCWRGYKAPVSKEWKGKVDDPNFIIENTSKAQWNLLQGFKGFKGADKDLIAESKDVKHAALSLTGEPIIYPRINEIIDLFHKKGISTFLVTNGQYPEEIKSLKPITQFYISLDSYDQDTLKKIDKPLFTDYWERANKSLEYMKEKKQRKAIRLTLIKDMNMEAPEKYVELIKKADPDFIEAKGYMFVGLSRQILSKENMPLHEEVVEFAKRLEKAMPDYEIVVDHMLSRAVLLAKKEFKIDGIWHTWIDFDKFFDLVKSGNDFSAKDYLKPTPRVGLSGRGTKERFGSYKK